MSSKKGRARSFLEDIRDRNYPKSGKFEPTPFMKTTLEPVIGTEAGFGKKLPEKSLGPRVFYSLPNSNDYKIQSSSVLHIFFREMEVIKLCIREKYKTYFSEDLNDALKGTDQNLWGTRAGTIDRGRRLDFRK